ncbi:LamB/YcsF family protein [Aquibacillus koreensis]|uniref:5-oxoprolinase subunit A n=1 Tax=Aquibacillus koreensis TaxID=279446 RepID=A0A9X3WMK0_9BACI|nr:5-oxoprolinase subunit PxpA [Aquibacillus koreensis]MCT2537227.1 LamB/YcsF family protein [Aquibacillus koreensis]MDC3421575.1 LamB/YcsF family protein [Aquibacillus koreensis]
MRTIDLNCDMGESFGAYRIGQDQEIVKYISSANIACGFHAGDPKTMDETVNLAIKHGVKIGAHPGYPDLNGFGRRKMVLTPEETYQLIVYQVGALLGFVKVNNGELSHVKPHGALYNLAAKDEKIATAIATAVYQVDPTLTLYGLSNSKLTEAGEKVGLTVAHEVFADRTYQADGTLTPRSEPNALLTDSSDAVDQVLQMIKTSTVTDTNGTSIPIKVDTVCLHGDGPHALAFAQQLHQRLSIENIKW